MVEQVRLSEKYMTATGNVADRIVFGFGTHDGATADQAHDVTSAKSVNNGLRVIIDELLVGNYLEEIQCRTVVDNDAYSAVPVGATPDDIARCSTAKDVLQKTCPGSNPLSVCICHVPGGCDGGLIAEGTPAGVLDVNQDGSADDTHFISDAVQIKCGSIMVPTDIDGSYWNPSGDQNVPALAGYDALGPAIVLKPGVHPLAPAGSSVPWNFLPTNTDCGLVFSPTVVDKQGEKVCAPPGGNVESTCSPGDVSAFKFHVEPLSVSATPITNGATNISRTNAIVLRFSAPVDPANIDLATALATGSITFSPALPNGTTVTAPTPDTLRIMPPTTGLSANTMYTITFTTSLTDYYGQPLPQTITLSFTTGM